MHNRYMQLSADIYITFPLQEKEKAGMIYVEEILLLNLTVAVHEAVNATCSVNKLALTCVEWVRSA